MVSSFHTIAEMNWSEFIKDSIIFGNFRIVGEKMGWFSVDFGVRVSEMESCALKVNPENAMSCTQYNRFHHKTK